MTRKYERFPESIEKKTKNFINETVIIIAIPGEYSVQNIEYNGKP